MTYDELARRARVCAQDLGAAGFGPDTLVGIAIDRSVELVVAMLAALEAGGAYVPLDMAYPADRLALMVRDAGLSLIVASSSAAPALPDGPARRVLLDCSQALPSVVPPHAPGRAHSQNLAYVIYTSGSTGVPKGVAIPHAGLTNHMRWMEAQFPLSPRDRVLQKTPTSFDASVWEFYAPLLSGATLVMARPERHVDGAFLVDEILAHDVSVIQMVPSLLRLCLADARFRECRSLRHVFSGGEPLTGDLVRRFAESGPPAALHNLYGPSEATIDAVAWTWPGDAPVSPVPIGRAIHGVSAYVLDSEGRPSAVGVPGELHLAGAGLARGYLHAPALTAERFVPNPYSSEPGARMYRTGDLSVYRPDGELEYLARLDTQVKVRGMRVELGEVEAHLRTHPAVRDAVAVVREDVPGDARLVGYVIAKVQPGPQPEDLRRFLAARLPDQMIPSSWVGLDAFPLGPNGKLDHRALPPPEGDSSSRRFVAPRTPIEARLVEIYAATLRARRVGVHDNFFDLGGHSLLATQLASRVRDAFDVDLPLRHVFHAPTPAELATVIEGILVEEVARLSEEETERLVQAGGSHAS